MSGKRPDFQEKVGVLAALALIAYASVNFILPSQVWFDVRKMDVLDAPYGKPVVVDFDRFVHRDVTIDRRVKVRRKIDGVFHGVCSITATRDDLVPNETIVRPVYLQFFTGSDASCASLPQGDYIMTVTWEINRVGLAGLFLGRTVTRTSAFSILPQGDPQ